MPRTCLYCQGSLGLRVSITAKQAYGMNRGMSVTGRSLKSLAKAATSFEVGCPNLAFAQPIGLDTLKLTAKASSPGWAAIG